MQKSLKYDMNRFAFLFFVSFTTCIGRLSASVDSHFSGQAIPAAALFSGYDVTRDESHLKARVIEDYLRSPEADNLQKHLPAILRFASHVLNDSVNRNKKLVVIGRGGDLIADALEALIHIEPHYADRQGDLTVWDWSLKKFNLFASPLQMDLFFRDVEFDPLKYSGIALIDEFGALEQSIVQLANILRPHVRGDLALYVMATIHRHPVNGYAKSLANLQEQESAERAAIWMASDFERQRHYEVHLGAALERTYMFNPHYNILRQIQKRIIAEHIRLAGSC
jgi:hypothetical protein